jgi:DNA repair protein RadC
MGGVHLSGFASLYPTYQLDNRRHPDITVKRELNIMKKEKAKYVREIIIKYKTRKLGKGIQGEKVTGPETVVRLFKDLQNETKEKLIVINLDNANRILCFELVAIGGTNVCYARPIEIFRSSFLTSAVSVVVIHNHPSGKPTPSLEDRILTKELVKVTNLIGLELLDHIIIGYEGHYSFAESGKIPRQF